MDYKSAQKYAKYKEQERVIYDAITFSIANTTLYGGSFDERIKAGDLLFKNIFGIKKFCSQFFLSKSIAFRLMDEVGMEILFPIFGSEDAMNQMGHLISIYRDIIVLKRKRRKAHKNGRSNLEDKLRRKCSEATKITNKYIKWVKKIAGIKSYSTAASLKLLKKAMKNPYKKDRFGYDDYDDDDFTSPFEFDRRSRRSSVGKALGDKYDLGDFDDEDFDDDYDEDFEIDYEPRRMRRTRKSRNPQYIDPRYFDYLQKSYGISPYYDEEDDDDEYEDDYDYSSFNPYMAMIPPMFNPMMYYQMMNMYGMPMSYIDPSLFNDEDDDDEYDEEEDYYEDPRPLKTSRRRVEPDDYDEDEEDDDIVDEEYDEDREDQYPLEGILSRVRGVNRDDYDDDDDIIDDATANSPEFKKFMKENYKPESISHTPSKRTRGNGRRVTI